MLGRADDSALWFSPKFPAGVAVQADPVRGGGPAGRSGIERVGDGLGQVLQPGGQVQVAAESGLVEPGVDHADPGRAGRLPARPGRPGSRREPGAGVSRRAGHRPPRPGLSHDAVMGRGWPGRPGPGIPRLARPDHDQRRAAPPARPAPLAARTARQLRTHTVPPPGTTTAPRMSLPSPDVIMNRNRARPFYTGFQFGASGGEVCSAAAPSSTRTSCHTSARCTR